MKKASAGQALAILDLLERDDSVRSLLPAAQRILEIQGELRRHLPAGLAGECEVCGLEQGALVIRVPSNSAASKLRQTLPRLAEVLSRQGWKVSSIRLRVQPLNSSRESQVHSVQTRKNAVMPASAVAQLQRLAGVLEPSPLRDALEKAVRHHSGDNPGSTGRS